MSVSGCPLGLFYESGYLAVHLQPLFMIGFEIAAQLSAFLKKLFHLGIPPGDLSFADHPGADSLCLGSV